MMIAAYAIIGIGMLFSGVILLTSLLSVWCSPLRVKKNPPESPLPATHEEDDEEEEEEEEPTPRARRLNTQTNVPFPKKRERSRSPTEAIPERTRSRSKPRSKQGCDRKDCHRHSHSEPRAHQYAILPYLYVGNRYAGIDLCLGSNPHQFTHAFNMADNLTEVKPFPSHTKCQLVAVPLHDEFAADFRSQIELHVFPLIREAAQAFQEGDHSKKILVFCRHGARRSVATILAYLLSDTQYDTFSAALHYFKSQSKLPVRLSYSYQRQLESWKEESSADSSAESSAETSA